TGDPDPADQPTRRRTPRPTTGLRIQAGCVPERSAGQRLLSWGGQHRDPQSVRDDVASLGEMAAAAPRRTKILATIGPASGSPELMAQLVAAGMDGARLNFSHGSQDQHRARAEAARAAAAEGGRPLALVRGLP